MSLYYESANVLNTAANDGGSIKSLAFSNKNWSSDPRTLYALTTETAKFSEILSEVITKSELLAEERQLTPFIALLLVHDLLLSRKGIALPSKHGLHAAIARHRARLTAEFTKARLRRGCASVEELRVRVNEANPSSGSNGSAHPRWIRINTLRTSLDEQLRTTFADFVRTSNLTAIVNASSADRLLYLDEHIPNLIAVPAKIDLSKTAAYRDGQLIFQDKASCFPACLLDPASVEGDVIDACAAPGNKTTHLAALVAGSEPEQLRTITACEKDKGRCATLTKMVKLGGADEIVTVRPNQDFLRLDPQAEAFANVSCLLLDPSCSGSGIVGRDEAMVTVHLPTIDVPEPRGKKRRRPHEKPPQTKRITTTSATAPDDEAEETAEAPNQDEQNLKTRLMALSEFQLRLVKHAMSFPAAKRITYSTCSVHDEENESVVVRTLLSDVAVQRGWRIMRRDEQVEGMKTWPGRGSVAAVRETAGEASNGERDFDMDEIADACIRCIKSGEDGTMGFFVAGFVRDPRGREQDDQENGMNGHHEGEAERNAGQEDGDWDGFSDDEP